MPCVIAQSSAAGGGMEAVAWYSQKLITDPVKTKMFTSMLVNPIGSIIGQLIQKGKVYNWKETRYFFFWGLGLGEFAYQWKRARDSTRAS